jgi:hypothetical protein
MSDSQLSPAAQDFVASGGIERAVFPEVQAPILAQPAVTQQQQQQDASKEVLLECLENMDEIDPLPKKHLMLAKPSDVQKNKKARKAPGPVDVMSLRRSSRLNKNSQGYKAQGAATRDAEQVFVGKFDKEAATELPLELSKENLQAIGSGFLKIQPMAMSDAALFAVSGDDEA